MQHFKDRYSNPDYFHTLGNIQKCLRLNDLDEVGDGSHYLDFEMIGLFSFRQWSVKETIDFFMSFLTQLNIKPDYVTIHPDKFNEWSSFYSHYNVSIRQDPECLWSDGNIGGYCTEFFKDDIEIGNIVNPLGDCIDVGFGLERLIMVKNGSINSNRLEILERCCLTMISSGIELGNKKESFILKKIITTCILEGSILDHTYFHTIRGNMYKNYLLYLRDKDKVRFKDKGKSFWKDSYGIDLDRIDFYKGLIVNLSYIIN
jgi:alanyl-tRNA synthetase